MDQIAIVGMECCFPGAENLKMFWHLLQSGTDAISEIPKKRWDSEKLYDTNPFTPGKMNTRRGGFLKDIDEFDADFFGISPREAERVDPQQRLVLEVAWKALENANIAADTLNNTFTGVFMGIAHSDYASQLSNNQKSLENLSAYDGIGNSLGVAANRLSYTLNLKGPSLAIETGCSSSLVAVHYACKSLLTNESNLCIAGGVNLMLTPDLTVIYSNAGMMASDGRCKTFDTLADGYVRGEGCGIVILKRLEDAIRDGNDIKAIIKGSAVNQDGRTNGITAPNGPSQQNVIRQALKNAGILPSQISYVEAHGTGTPLGDPIEINSLKAVLSQERLPGDVCWIGSVKTNIGHLESAAGIASLIKTVLSLQKCKIPAHLNLENLNSNIHLDRGSFRIPQKCISWNVNKGSRIAGINSFGFGGTNCHLIVEEASKLKSNNNNAQQNESSLNLLQLSAKTQLALQSLAEKYLDFLELHPEINLSDICYSARVGRKHFKHRLAIVADSRHQLYHSLTDFYKGDESKQVITCSEFVRKHKKVAFLFTGQSKNVDFGRFLYEKNSVFRQAIEYCSDISKSYLEYPLQEILYPSSDLNGKFIKNSAYYQPAVFAFEYSLYQLWISLGVKPNLVMGHSLGEYVAACVSGLISVENAMRLVVERGRLTQKFSGKGMMVAVFASEEKVSALIQEANQEDVVIAAVNSTENTVISGNIEAVKKVIKLLSTHDISSTELDIPNHFHSPLLQPIVQDFRKITDQIKYLPVKIPFVSCLNGKLLSEGTLTSDYWCQHLLKPVLFKAGVETLNKQGCKLFLEIGSESVLIKMGQKCLPDVQNLWVSSLDSQSKFRHLLQTLGKLYVSGVTTTGSVEDRAENSRNLIELPTYSFQRQKYWSNHDNEDISMSSFTENIQSKLLVLDNIIFKSKLDSASSTFLYEHSIFNKSIMPISAFLEIAMAASSYLLKSEEIAFEDISIIKPLGLAFGETENLQVAFQKETQERYSFKINNINLDDSKQENNRVLHLFGKLNKHISGKDIKFKCSLLELQKRLTNQINVEKLYQSYKYFQVSYGLNLQAIKQLWHSDNEILAQVELPENIVYQLKDYKFHPILLESCLQGLQAFLMSQTNYNQDVCVDWVYVPNKIKHFQMYKSPSSVLWSYIKLYVDKHQPPQNLLANVNIFDSSGQLVVTLDNVQFNRVSKDILLKQIDKDLRLDIHKLNQESKAEKVSNFSHTRILENSSSISLKQKENLSKIELITYEKLQNKLELQSTIYIIEAFYKMGCKFIPNQRISSDNIFKKLGIIPKYKRLFVRLLDILKEAEVIKQVDDYIEYLNTDSIFNQKEDINELLANYPFAKSEITLIAICGEKLAEILKGEYDALQLLFPNGESSLLSDIYHDSIGAYLINQSAYEAIERVLQDINLNRKLEILELGAGTGGTTLHLLKQLRLSSNSINYTFTDVSPFFIEEAKKKLESYSYVNYRLLNIEKDPEQQGFDNQKFDLIIAANVLHATESLNQTLSHIRSLLTKDGVLIILEATRPMRWLDITFGLTEGWWLFNDFDVRPNYPLINGDKWKEIILKNGFKDATAIYPEQNNISLPRQAVIVAQNVDKKETKSDLLNYNNENTVSTNNHKESVTTLSLNTKLLTEERVIFDVKSYSKDKSLETLITYITKHVEQTLGMQKESNKYQNNTDSNSINIDIHQPFLELGLDSLMAIQLKNQICKNLNIDLPIAKLFESSVFQLAEIAYDQLIACNLSETKNLKLSNNEKETEEYSI